MAYTVLFDFSDMRDNHFVYRKGDTYPREGLAPSPDRIAELSGTKNRMGIALIEAKAENRQTKKTAKRSVKGAEK